MALIVQKYGGTSVANLDRIRNVVNRVIKTHEAGNQVVVVLSAMSGITDSLIKMATEAAVIPDKRELDVLLATGEQTTAALAAIMLIERGYSANSMLGHQVNILTDSSFGDARIKDISVDKLKTAMAKNKIIVVPGFQGVDEEGHITTLGRGGSDTSAVALAAALKADVCEIYTDVDGVYTADPRICPKARKLNSISYEEMMETASLGAKVLQIRSVEFAKNFNVPVHVRSSFNEEEGTMVVNEDLGMENLVVSGVTYSKNDARITITDVPDSPGIAAKIFSTIAKANISVDMIIQNNRSDGSTDLTFTVAKKDFRDAMGISGEIAKSFNGFSSVSGNEDIAKVSVTGVGMRSHPGVAAQMFEALAEAGINIHMISTSEIRISCLIDLQHTDRAVCVLHTAFGLDKE